MKTPEDLSKEQLLNDLIKLRHRINELEKIERDKKRYEEELSRTKAMFEGLFEFAPDAIVVVSREGRIVQVNKQTERLFGYTREELLSADHDILVPERFGERHLEDRRGYMSDPHVHHMGTGLELYGRNKDGAEFPVDIALGPLQMKDDIVVLAVVRDFTARKEAERKLLETKAELERSNKELEQFAYSVSHGPRARWTRSHILFYAAAGAGQGTAGITRSKTCLPLSGRRGNARSGLRRTRPISPRRPR